MCSQSIHIEVSKPKFGGREIYVSVYSGALFSRIFRPTDLCSTLKRLWKKYTKLALYLCYMTNCCCLVLKLEPTLNLSRKTDIVLS